MEPRTFSYTPASAHRAALAFAKRMIPPFAIICVAMTIISWQRSADKPLFVRIVRAANPVIIVAAIGLSSFFASRGTFSSSKYICTPDALTHATQWNEYTIERTQVGSLDVSTSSLTLQPVRGNAIRVPKELDDYPELLEILRSWNPPKVIYRDADLRRLALTYIPPTLGIALLYYLLH